MKEKELLTFSHSLHVLYVPCIDCNKKRALELFKIYFSNIDIVETKEEALRLFHNSRYDLLIAGLKIPKRSIGISFIEEIRSITKDLTILTVASDLTQTQFTKLIELNIDAFLVKPIEAQQFNEIIHKTIERLKNKEDVYHYRVSLEKQVQEQVEQIRQKDKILLQQSKLAAMGEMMDAVAHQWKQPINTIKMKIDFLEYDYDDNKVDKDYIIEHKKHLFEQLNHMTTTLGEFRTFFRPTKVFNQFNVKEMVEKVLLLIKDELIKHNIKVNLLEKEVFKILGIENEFKHLVLNIINNSKDAFAENGITNKKIDISIFQNRIELEDNAGGIPEQLIHHIFKINFTSKKGGKGTGIGLYMSSQIAQKHFGKLSATNIENGVKFTFELNPSSKLT